MDVGRVAVFLAIALAVPSVALGGRGGRTEEAERTLDRMEAIWVPPRHHRPWVYWWWLNANVTKASITRDLKAMAEQGIGGFLLFDVTAYGHHIVPAPPRKIDFMSPEWRALVLYALEEAHRLGLTASINLSTCGGALRAPWDMKEHAVKKLIWTSAGVQGPGSVSMEKPVCTDPYYESVATLAARVENDALELRSTWNPSWSPVVEAIQKDADVVSEVIDLTRRIDDTGRLIWDAPAGRWIVLQFACVAMKDRTQDVDILRREAVEEHFDRMGRAIIADAGPLVGTTLTHFYNVSWEGETPSWTNHFERDFTSFRGYDLRPLLPVLAGLIVSDRDHTERFLRDYALTISDCFMENCYGRFDELCREAGLAWHSESGGPWSHKPLLFREADQLAFWGRNAMPQGEFWVPGYRSNARRTAMAAHIYGRRLASVEAFTHMGYHWSQYPASLKRPADLAFCDGINQFVWHTSTASPEKFGLPGIVYFAGTHVNRNVTWYEFSSGFFDYLARCQSFLRHGHFVADVCCYVSDKNCETWGRSSSWGDEASLSLPKGYAYDLVNAEVLTERMGVDNQGDLVLPDGMRYRLLVVDLAEDVMPVEALRKVLELARQGATVILGEKIPTRSPGLKDHPRATREVRELSEVLWSNSSGSRKVGRGRVICGRSLSGTLDQMGLLPDCTGATDFIHRHDRSSDIYFIVGEGRVDPTFRACRGEPEIWDAASGRIRPAVRYSKASDGRITLPMTLPENGSIFIVFRDREERVHLTAANGPARITIKGRDREKATLQFWKNGRYTFANSDKEETSIDIQGLPEPSSLDCDWQVRFQSGWGAPASVHFDRLVAWDRNHDENIKFFSGTATYCKRVDLTLKQAQGLVRLDLGRVGCIARVKLNGEKVSLAWTAPWAVELTESVRLGENWIEIDVANVWQNRLIGDAGLPEAKRRTGTNVLLEKGERTGRYRCSSVNSIDPLVPSGLIGPVRLEFGEERCIGLSGCLWKGCDSGTRDPQPFKQKWRYKGR